MVPPASLNPLTLRTTWTKKMILSCDAIPLLSFAWKRDRTVADLEFFHVPDNKLCELIIRMPEESFGLHLDHLQTCPWKDALLADERVYGKLFTVRHPISIKHTYYALSALSKKLPVTEVALALTYVLALDFERTTAYFLDGFPSGATLKGFSETPASLVLPLLVSCQYLPVEERHDFVNLVESFVDFFAQANITTTDFLSDFTNILTETSTTVVFPVTVNKLLSLARSEDFSELLKTVTLYEYLARIGHRINLDLVASWPELVLAIRAEARDIAREIAGLSELDPVRDRKVLDTFLLALPDYLLYQHSSRWNEEQKRLLHAYLTSYMQTGSLTELKYPPAWRADLTVMLGQQWGSGSEAEAFVSRWTNPATLFTYDYSADPKLKREELDRLEQLHAHVDLGTLGLSIPPKYQHLLDKPFTNTFYEMRAELKASGAALPEEPPFLLLEAQKLAKIRIYKEQSEVRYDPTKPDSVFIKSINGLFRESWLGLQNRELSELELHGLEEMRERIARMIMGLAASKEIPNLVETVLEHCGLDRRRTPVELQERLRKRLREAIAHHRRQYKDFYDNMMQYKLSRYFHDDPTRLARLTAVIDAPSYEQFSQSRTHLLSSIHSEVTENRLLASLIGDQEIAYLRKLIYTHNFNRALALFDCVATKETRLEKPRVHQLVVNYARLLAQIKSSSNKTSGADARERLEGFVALLGKNWDNFDRLLKHEGTPRALEYLSAGFRLTDENRDYLIEVSRNYLANETRRVYAKIEVWDSDRFLDWITVARTVYEPHVAHQQSCMHPDKINARSGKTEYLMGYIASPWVKQLYLGSRDLFDPFDEHNKIRCILFLTPAYIDGKEYLTLNLQHPYPLNPTREVWRVLMEGCRQLSTQYGLPLLFPNISTEELQHAAIQTRSKLFDHITSRRLNVLVPRNAAELQQRDDCELSQLPSVKVYEFLGARIEASMITSTYWVIFPETSGMRIP